MGKKLNIKDLPEIKVYRPQDLDAEKLIKCRILIVCEGEKTEPFYFQSFSMVKNSGSFVYEIKTDGGGINTIGVVKLAIELKEQEEQSGNPYDSVWAVFDKDSFSNQNFNLAIMLAEKSQINCAWSNEAFELWYVLHFENRTTPMSRKDYEDKLTDLIRKAGYQEGKNPFRYEKKEKKMRQILKACGGNENMAIRFAETQYNTYTDTRYHTHNPCTTVFKLVRLLNGQDKKFNESIKEKVNDSHC